MKDERWKLKEDRWEMKEISNNKTGVTPASCHRGVKRELINPTQGRLFLLAARHNPSKTWLLLSLRSVGCHLYPQNIPLVIPFLALSGSVEWRVSSLIFPLSSFLSHLSFVQKNVVNWLAKCLNVKRKLTFIKNLKNCIKKFAQYCFRPYLCTRSFKVHLG